MCIRISNVPVYEASYTQCIPRVILKACYLFLLFFVYYCCICFSIYFYQRYMYVNYLSPTKRIDCGGFPCFIFPHVEKSLFSFESSPSFLLLIGGHDQRDGTQHPLLDRGAFLHPKRGQKDKRRATKRRGVDGAFQDFAVVAQIADFTGVPSWIDGDGTNVHDGQRRQQFFQGRVDQVTPVEKK